MQYVGFNVDGSEYCVPITKVQEIINLPAITKIPNAEFYVEGVTNLRGKVIPLINFRKFMGLRDSVNCNGSEKVIVMSNGKVISGILVDSITGVMKVEDSAVQPASELNAPDIVTGIANVYDRLIVMLDTKKLAANGDNETYLDDEIIEAKQIEGDKVEVVKKIEGMGGAMVVKEVMDAKDFFEKKGISSNDPRCALLDDMVGFMNAIAAQDYEKADEAIQKIMNKGQSDLFKEVGRVTRKLHDSIRSFKEAIDPRLKDMAVTEMPSAIDKLQFVIDKSEEAANKTMNIAEKYILGMDDLATHIRNLKEPDESVAYLKDFKNKLEDDLTEILTAQSFQDITGQSIKKVIKLVGDIEEELVKLIATFGVKIDHVAKVEVTPEKVSQEDVDDLLKDFGF